MRGHFISRGFCKTRMPVFNPWCLGLPGSRVLRCHRGGKHAPGFGDRGSEAPQGVSEMSCPPALMAQPGSGFHPGGNRCSGPEAHPGPWCGAAVSLGLRAGCGPGVRERVPAGQLRAGISFLAAVWHLQERSPEGGDPAE